MISRIIKNPKFMWIVGGLLAYWYFCLLYTSDAADE